MLRRYSVLKNPAIWLVKSIFAYNLRTRPYPIKTTWLKFSVHGCLTTYEKRTSYHKSFLRYFSLKSSVLWLAESIFAYNPRTWFFQDIQFSQNQKGNYGALFKPNGSTRQWIKFLCKIQKALLWGDFLGINSKMRFFKEILLHQFITLKDTITSLEVSANSHELP